VTEDQYFNAAVLIDADGQVVGAHHKVLVLRGGTESWATPGCELKTIAWQGSKVGLLICADAYNVSHAEELARQGANVLLGLAAWAPGAHGPSGEWETCSKNTGLCFYVCNRTGKDTQLSFEGSASIVAVNGTRKAEYSDVRPAILTMDVDAESWLPIGEDFSVFR
jgi:predicted amidohydrolase